MEHNVVIYTDGACSGNPGPGGWGAILMYDDYKKEISGYNENTTNNIMEITAVLEAVKLLKNKELWEELYNNLLQHKFEFIKVKGHSDNEYNNRCDLLATDEIKKNT